MRMKTKQPSTSNNTKSSGAAVGLITFKSSIYAICVWWISSVGLSAVMYFLYLLIQRILEMFQSKVNTYQPTFDDVVSGLKGKVYHL